MKQRLDQSRASRCISFKTGCYGRVRVDEKNDGNHRFAKRFGADGRKNDDTNCNIANINLCALKVPK